MIRRRFAQKSTNVMGPTLIKQDGEVIEAHPYGRGPVSSRPKGYLRSVRAVVKFNEAEFDPFESFELVQPRTMLVSTVQIAGQLVGLTVKSCST